MRLSEFTHNLANLQRLDEVNMSPSSLRSLASNINARAGMEFEMCVSKTIEDGLDQRFSEALGKPVRNSLMYHNSDIDRPDHENNFYLVEPDGSIRPDNDNDIGVEFVSPAMPVAEMISDLDKVAKWAATNGCYTNKSTGLHINISVDNWSSQKGQLDYVKLVLLTGDQHILSEFNRHGNQYCKNALENIYKWSSCNFSDLFREMKSGLNGLAQDILDLGAIDKYTSIHPKDGYVEFRAPGGDWLGIYQSNPAKIINTMLRYVVALDAAVNPEKYREDYLKKLYAMVKPETKHDPLAYFAQYAAGEISFNQLARNTSVIRSRRNTKLVGDISNLTGAFSPKLTGKVSPHLKGDVSNITGDVSNITGELNNIEGDVSNINGDLSNIQGNVNNIKGRVTRISWDVSNIKGDVSNIRGYIGLIKGDVSNIRGYTGNIKGDVNNISGDVSNIDGDVSNIWGDVSNIEGTVAWIKGDVSKLKGSVGYIRGDVSNIRGDVSYLMGDATGCKGDVTGLHGNIRTALNVGP